MEAVTLESSPASATVLIVPYGRQVEMLDCPKFSIIHEGEFHIERKIGWPSDLNQKSGF